MTCRHLPQKLGIMGEIYCGRTNNGDLFAPPDSPRERVLNMANIQARKNREGQIISYSIRVYRGRDPQSGKQLTPFSHTWRVPEGWSEKRARREAEKQAVLFERQCRQDLVSGGRQTFAEYAEYVLTCKTTMGMKHLTEIHYRQSLKRVLPVLGPMKLCDIKPQHLNLLYQALSSPEARNDNRMEEVKPILWKTLEERVWQEIFRPRAEAW